MMRNDEQVRVKRSAVPADQVGLGARLDVAGEQRAARGIADAQHAGQIVGLEFRVDVIRFDRMQQRELDAVPLPAPAGSAALGRLAAFDAGTDDDIVTGKR